MISAHGLGARVTRALAAVNWYLREVSGESAYDRYLQRHDLPAGGPVLSRREFERQRLEDSCTPGHRCC